MEKINKLTMKKLILILLLFVSIGTNAQCHLNATMAEVKDYHPECTWELSYSESGTPILTTSILGNTWGYFFTLGTSSACMMIPGTQGALNAQIEVYNSKYVITSDKSWTAYLENGGMFYIKLEATEDGYYFLYYQ